MGLLTLAVVAVQLVATPQYGPDPLPHTPDPPDPTPVAVEPVEPTVSVAAWLPTQACETGGEVDPWAYNGPSGYDGGLQFSPTTWSAYAPAGYPAYAYLASPEQQVVVAELVLAVQGPSAWPNCPTP